MTNKNLAGFESQRNETRDTELEWQGTPPGWLDGVLLRTGPALFEAGKASYRHWFDGLAMLHRFAFASGRCRYANRFLQSGAYKDALALYAIARGEFATNPAGPFWSQIAARLWGKQTDNGNVNVLAFGSHDIVALTETPRPLRFDPSNARNPRALRMVQRAKVSGYDGASAFRCQPAAHL
jgi:beta,beta-carotene 9',10'-dioxygenase